jgi:hypothetical protein
MKAGWVAFAAGLLACTAATAADDFAGIYASSVGAYKWRAVITPKGGDAYKVSVKVSSAQPHCLGEIEAVGRLQAGRIVTQPPDQGDSCVLTISRSGGGIAVVEQACSMDHGTSCEFTSRMTRAKR